MICIIYIIYTYIIYIIYIYIYISNGFLKIKRKEAQIDFINKDKSSEIHIDESIIKSKLLGIKMLSKLNF